MGDIAKGQRTEAAAERCFEYVAVSIVIKAAAQILGRIASEDAAR